ncbi:hypothetical protein BBP40_011831 [Aspergillus hancockii]|nr:hypothetical protein BBP40_011831 [Aspergillus hancockii]
MLHYGTDPLGSYHISTAYTPLSSQSPLRVDKTKARELGSSFHVALTEFRAYANALRNAVGRLSIRFVNADALAFYQTLQYLREHGEKTAGWYKHTQSCAPLVLDASDYVTQDSAGQAPLSFDIIDTSNLVDHLGCLNLLAAAGPLLTQKPSSTFSTGMLVRREDDIE